MLSRKKLIVSITLIIIITGLTAFGAWKENAEAIDISGGEDHTLVLTNDKTVWACGPNGGYTFQRYYYGVLGTGSDYWGLAEQTLVRVHDGNMVTASGYLEEIIDVSAGWKHSLALDVNGSVWSWGWNSWGQLGVDDDQYRTTPVQVFRGGSSSGSLSAERVSEAYYCYLCGAQRGVFFGC